MNTNGRGLRCPNEGTRSHQQETGARLYLCARCEARLNPTFRPPATVASVARRALELRRKYRRYVGEPGRAARDLAARRPLRLETIERMKAYFQRHDVDRLAYGFYPEEEAYPSAGRIAWDLWGGDAGRDWAERITGGKHER